jgi:hypothetical protein
VRPLVRLNGPEPLSPHDPKYERGVTTVDSLLQKLSQESKLLKNNVVGHSNSHISRNLSQLNLASRKLARKPRDPSDDSKARILLAAGGLDSSMQKQVLDQIDVLRSFEPRELSHEVDIDKFLNHRYETLKSTAIDESHQLTSHAFRQKYVSRLEEDWEEAKREILEIIGVDHAVRQPDQKADWGTARKRRHEFTPQPVMVEYASVISAWNTQRLRPQNREPFQLLSRLNNITNNFFPELADYFKVVSSILFRDQETDLYSRPTDSKLVDGALRNLESEYLRDLTKGNDIRNENTIKRKLLLAVPTL